MENGWIKYSIKWKDISQPKAKTQRKEKKWVKDKWLQQNMYIDLTKLSEEKKIEWQKVSN